MSTNLQFIKSVSGASVTSLSVTNCFSSAYDVYAVTVDIDKCGSSGDWAFLRFIDSGGSVISDAEYDWASLSMFDYTGFTEEKGGGQSSISRIQFVKSNGGGGNTFLNIFNPNDSSSFTFTQHKSSMGTAGQLIASKVIGIHRVAEQITGLSIVLTQTMNNIKISIYGVN